MTRSTLHWAIYVQQTYKTFAGANFKSLNYQDVVVKLKNSYGATGCNMSLNIHFHN